MNSSIITVVGGCGHVGLPLGVALAESATVVVNNDGQMLVAALVEDLISPDPPEVGELVMELLRVIPDSGDDRPDGAPRDPHQLGDRGLRRLGGKPRDGCIEVVGVTGLMA